MFIGFLFDWFNDSDSRGYLVKLVIDEDGYVFVTRSDGSQGWQCPHRGIQSNCVASCILFGNIITDDEFGSRTWLCDGRGPFPLEDLRK